MEEKMAENTEAIYWAMLMELEGACKDKKSGMMPIIRAGYRHWNATHPDKKPLISQFDMPNSVNNERNK